jgi:hypothetical protein
MPGGVGNERDRALGSRLLWDFTAKAVSPIGANTAGRTSSLRDRMKVARYEVPGTGLPKNHPIFGKD